MPDKKPNEIVGYDYWYRADDTSHNPDDKWWPSILMPHEAARLWFRVTDVKVQKLEDVTEQDAVEDGFQDEYVEELKRHHFAVTKFKDFWLDQYGADRPWMWVYYLQPVIVEERLEE